VGSPQTLSEADRRIVAAWAADCAERVLRLFEAEAPGDSRPRDAIARTRAFARGELGVAAEIRRRFVAGAAAREVSAPAPVAAARAAGQAASIPHMGAHALAAAAYAAKAAVLAAPDQPDAVREEICWQLGRMSPAARAALRQLPPVGENPSGPLGPGLLASGLLGTIIRDLQAGLAKPDHTRPVRSQTDPDEGNGGLPSRLQAAVRPGEPALPPRIGSVIDESTDFGARVARRLREEKVVWLTTVTPSGAPLPRPVGFLWDGADTVSIYSQPGARIRNIARNPKVTLNFDGDGHGGDIVVLSGMAKVDESRASAADNTAWVTKYGPEWKRSGMAAQSFAQRFSVPVRVHISAVHGH
jgi:PPOX class probable F420-dependent enzyme